MRKLRFNLKGGGAVPASSGGSGGIRRNNNASKSFRVGMRRGSNGLKVLGRSLKSGVTWASVFPEDLKVSERKIFDPQDKTLLQWNKFFQVFGIISVSFDPLFFYLPYFNHKSYCLAIDNSLARYAVTLRTIFDAIYILRISFQFRTAFIAPSSRVFGRGELVIDPAEIAKRYLRRYFIVDFLSVLPLPQIVVWRYLHDPARTKITGSVWYLLAVERNDTCWRDACMEQELCFTHFLYCGGSNKRATGYEEWRKISPKILKAKCSADDDEAPFDYGIFNQAITSNIVASINFFPKLCYCLWWGVQNISTLGQGLEASTYVGEILFCIVIAVLGLVLFAVLIGKMQNFLQSMSVRLEEMRIRRRDSEQWMHHRLLPAELREKVRRYDKCKWFNTRGVDEESLVQKLPKDLRRDIKRYLCLNLVRRVPLFANMDERLLDAICERLKPCLHTKGTCIIREGDPVNEMLFIVRGQLESVTTDGGRSGFFNRGFLKEGDFCGEELLTWALDPKSSSNLPSSTRTVKAMEEMEAFALEAEELKFVASQFRRFHSRQVQHTFRFYSQQWRTWAAIFIQAAWRRYQRRKIAAMLHINKPDDESDEDDDDDETKALVPSSSTSSSSITTANANSNSASSSSTTSRFGLDSAMYASRFATNLRGQRLRSSSSESIGLPPQKPREPDFSHLDEPP
ncbi:putative cyclic nucleotide-gated ion channel 8 [Stylosanthes scabra]|uniref:Cyclic nucleotide-gated ion channel 8 n=1 Tax=Stylosanthes scabra TaxID=79078 RepID=A0ABU6T4B3_9FABA|nr:putative cyclic nucleotide-gated ion channel 8 [Stylosanthes scabra]